MTRKRALVTGAYGIVGLNVVEELMTRADWSVLTCGRRPDPPVDDIDYLRVDLIDAEQTRTALAAASDCTHLFFGAFQYVRDPYEESAFNVAILRNTLDALRAARAPLKHVLICEGSKAYGALIGPMRTPAKESDPRIPGPLYYYDQEDLLWECGPRDGFNTTIMRPDFIAGIGLGNYTNVVTVVAVYASICKALNLPLHFPGNDAAFGMLFQLTDARLLARGMVWAAETQGGKDEIFNITNGDVFRWSNVWSRVAKYFGLEVGQTLNIDLPLFMRDKGALWEDLMRQYGLTRPLDRIINWDHGQIVGPPYEIHTSSIKIRQAGFQECLDTDDQLFVLFDEMKARKIIP